MSPGDETPSMGRVTVRLAQGTLSGGLVTGLGTLLGQETRRGSWNGLFLAGISAFVWSPRTQGRPEGKEKKCSSTIK